MTTRTVDTSLQSNDLTCALCGAAVHRELDKAWHRRRTTDGVVIRFPGYTCPSCGSELVDSRSEAAGSVGIVEGRTR